MEWWKAERASTSASSEGHRHAGRDAVGDQPQRAVARRAVEVEVVVDPGIGHRRDERGVAVDHADVTEQALVQDGVGDRPGRGCRALVSRRRWPVAVGDLRGRPAAEPSGCGWHGRAARSSALSACDVNDTSEWMTSSTRAVGVDHEGACGGSRAPRSDAGPRTARPPCRRCPRGVGTRSECLSENCFCFSTGSALMPTGWAPTASNSAVRSRKWQLSRVQP